MIKIFYILVITILILYFLLLLTVDVLNEVNVHEHMLVCENKLKMIAKAINLYQSDWDGQWPESLEAMQQYYSHNRIPTCPGNRNEQETGNRWNYYYFKPRVKEVVPICLDSNPHYNTQPKLAPATKRWNVLYSDGHVEQLEKKELLKELEKLTASNPDVLKELRILTGEK